MSSHKLSHDFCMCDNTSAIYIHIYIYIYRKTTIDNTEIGTYHFGNESELIDFGKNELSTERVLVPIFVRMT